MRLKYIILLFLIAGNITISAKVIDKRFKILPKPQTIEMYDGKGIQYSEFTYLLSTEKGIMPVLSDMLDALPRYKKSGRQIILSLTDKDVPSSDEGYVLKINSEGAYINSRSVAGLFYGCQTLEQLMEDSRDFGIAIPFMKITDYPSVSYRAVHFDSKHHLECMDYYYRQIDKLARYKINAVIWEIEDKLRYESCPEIAAPNAISIQQMQALCCYAKDRNIDISPLVQGLGHAGFILKHHWELRENPESDWEFCPSDDRTYELQFKLYKDALKAMPYGKYLHVGGDEITNIGIDERCKATGKNAFELQMIWLKKVCDYAVDNDRIPIFWDDMPLKYGDVWDLSNSKMSADEVAKTWNSEKLDQGISLFPKECVYMRWNYRDATRPGHQRILKWYHDKGLKVMGATAAAFGESPFMPRENSLINNIKGFCGLVAKNNLDGILATAWDDGSPHSETVWRGFIALAEYAWNREDIDVNEFGAMHAQREFGFRQEDNMMQFILELEESASYFDNALVTSGKRNPAWGVDKFTLVDLPNLNKPGEWSLKYKDRVEAAKKEMVRYDKICKNLELAQRKALRNRFTLEVYQKNNDLFCFPAKIMLALNELDNVNNENESDGAVKNISKLCSDFTLLRESFESTYSKSRIMEQPDGYIMDQNHANHLAAKSNNADWWYYYELPMVRKLQSWIETIKK